MHAMHTLSRFERAVTVSGDVKKKKLSSQLRILPRKSRYSSQVSL